VLVYGFIQLLHVRPINRHFGFYVKSDYRVYNEVLLQNLLNNGVRDKYKRDYESEYEIKSLTHNEKYRGRNRIKIKIFKLSFKF